jgi:hypothetical protein
MGAKEFIASSTKIDKKKITISVIVNFVIILSILLFFMDSLVMNLFYLSLTNKPERENYCGERMCEWFSRTERSEQ